MKNSTPSAQPFGGWRELMKIAWPLMISSGSFAVLNFSDRLFLSWYSEDAFRASLPAGILFFTLTCGFMALAGVANTFVAQYWGAGNKEGCARSIAQGIWFSLLAFPVILALTPIGLLFLQWSGHEASVLALEVDYFRILMWSGGGMVMSSALSSFFSGRGKTRVIMTCNIFANGINILLNYLFVFGKWGLPELGIIGAGWATVIGSWITPLILAILYFGDPRNADFKPFKNLRYDPWLFKRMIKFGLPSGVHWFLDVAAFTLFVLMVGRLGPIAHIASNMALSINLIAFMPMVGMGIASSILVGQYLGRNQPDYAARVGWLAWRIGVGYVLVIGATFVLVPQWYISVFEGQVNQTVSMPELMKTVRILLIMLAVWGVGETSSLIFSGSLKGAGDTHFVMYFQSFAAWLILVPGQLLIVLYLKWNVFASWSCTLFYILLLGGGFLLRFRSGRWKRIDLLERRSTGIADPVPFEL